MQNIMLDIETMGIGSDAAILSIGAVKFNRNEGITDRFYKVIDLQSCIDKGLSFTGETITWWMRQSEDARNQFKKKGEPLRDVLKELKEWFGTGNFQVWGNGSDFDNVIARNAFAKFNAIAPWKYHENRCFRTLKFSFPTIDVGRVGTYHNAVNDAEHQAKYLIKLVRENKLRNVI